MKILFVTTHLPPDNHFGGVVQSGQALLISFNRFLSSVIGCCVSRNPEAITSGNPLKPVCAETRLFHRWGFSPWFSSDLRPLVSEADIVAVNGIMTYPMTVTGRMCKRMGKPYVVSVRGGLLPGAMSTKTWRKKMFYLMFIRVILAGAAVIHTTSDTESEHVAALGLKTPITIVPNGANLPPNNNSGTPEDLPAQIRSLPADSRLVLFLSRVDPLKGLDILLHAWADIRCGGKHHKTTLVIAGPDHRGYTRKLKVMTGKLGIENDVIFLGMIDGASKWALYRRADVFVLPSYSENFGLVVTEALGCETPVITTTGTPWKELESWDAGRWVAPERDALTAALRELLGMSGEDLRAMGARGRELVEKNYAWDTIARKLITVYRCALNGEDIPLYPEPAEV